MNLLDSSQKSAAQSKADILQALRTKFGVTFHSNMDLKTIAAQWKTAVLNDPTLVKQYPEIEAAVVLANVSTIKQEAITLANTLAKKAKNIAAQLTTLISSANPLSPNPAFIGLEAASVATAVLLPVNNILIETATKEALKLIQEIPPTDPSLPSPPKLPTAPSLPGASF